MATIDPEDRRLYEHHYVRPTYGAIRAEGMIAASQAAFWRRSVHETIGYLSESLTCAFDYEWFLRVTQRFDAWHVPEIWGGLRIHDTTKAALLAQRFTREEDVVRLAHPFPKWKTPLYRVRRATLTLMRGDGRYLFSRIADRIRSAVTGEPRKNRASQGIRRW